MRADEYLATSRTMMIVSGTVAVVGGMFLAPVLSHGEQVVTVGYRIAFGVCMVAFIGASYTFALQARDLRRWNLVRVSQPILSLLTISALWRFGLLSLNAAMLVLGATMTLQLLYGYVCCRATELAPGRARVRLVQPLAVYGVAQVAAMTPAALNSQLDQLVLSQTVPAADLGRYAVAVSLTLLPVPLVGAIGNVTFPRLASRQGSPDGDRRLQRLALLGSVVISLIILVPLASAANWVVPLVFGASYRGAVPLLWVLTPGAVFLSCGQVVGDLLRGRNRPIVVAWAQGLAAVATIGLILALLPFVGVYGAAVASTVAYGIALAVMLRALRQALERPEEAKRRSAAHVSSRTRSGKRDEVDGTTAVPSTSSSNKHRGVRTHPR
jgi:O-antigen/teichoic acid export membrane protein